MAKSDLHVHSKYSDVPSTWILRAYDSPESFTAPELVYSQAKSRGMDFVTLTDHDDIRGALELIARHPDDCFVSCEITTYFPDDQCKVHVLVYGISETQYNYMMAIRRNIYTLRDYIVEQNIAYSVAHATHDQDGKFAFKHIEKLVLLFDVFEVINGGADAQNNQLLHRYLENLDDQTLDQLQCKHTIKPISIDPWIKGYTGGSDDHSGYLIGSAYTQSSSTSIEEFLDRLRDKTSLANGLHGSFETYAIGVFKHIHDYRTHRDAKYINSKMNDFFELFFSGEKGNWSKRFRKSQSLRFLKRKNSKTHSALHRLLDDLSQQTDLDIAQKIPSVYQNISDLHDEMFSSLVTALIKHIPSGDIFKGINRLSNLFPLIMLAAPFIGSMRHQVLKGEIKGNLINGTDANYTHKALWLTDTIDDLNGVSVTLRQIAKQSQIHGYHLKLVTCVDIFELSKPLPTNTLNFHPVKSVSVPGYEQQKIGFPSLLKVMQTIADEQPDQIIISTPGPLGIAGMLCAKLMDLPIKTIYHTDFAEQLLRMTGEVSLANIADQAVNFFYRQADTVFVPSIAYIEKLTMSGFNSERLSIFPRDLDLQLYSQGQVPPSLLKDNCLRGSFTLLFAGRISEDKNLEVLIRTFQAAEQQKPGLYNLVIAGDGPDMDSLRESLKLCSNVHFTGRIDSQELVDWYRASDLLVFPSHTDTFGMVVLEAQACGLPCLVSSSGGPKEIIKANETGQVIHSDLSQDWLSCIHYYRRMKLSRPQEYAELRERCSKHIRQQSNWADVFSKVVGDECKLPRQTIEKLGGQYHDETTPPDIEPHDSPRQSEAA
jgi:glycosyltransferase involved in cell wall biosynthesis/predicted metal-dependent phosphoesterase TrpH